MAFFVVDRFIIIVVRRAFSFSVTENIYPAAPLWRLSYTIFRDLNLGKPVALALRLEIVNIVDATIIYGHILSSIHLINVIAKCISNCSASLVVFSNFLLYNNYNDLIAPMVL